MISLAKRSCWSFATSSLSAKPLRLDDADRALLAGSPASCAATGATV
jgi:hypothetical protein